MKPKEKAQQEGGLVARASTVEAARVRAKPARWLVPQTEGPRSQEEVEAWSRCAPHGSGWSAKGRLSPAAPEQVAEGELCGLRGGRRGVMRPPGRGMARPPASRRNRGPLSIRGRGRAEGRQGAGFPRPTSLEERTHRPGGAEVPVEFGDRWGHRDEPLGGHGGK